MVSKLMSMTNVYMSRVLKMDILWFFICNKLIMDNNDIIIHTPKRMLTNKFEMNGCHRYYIRNQNPLEHPIFSYYLNHILLRRLLISSKNMTLILWIHLLTLAYILFQITVLVSLKLKYSRIISSFNVCHELYITWYCSLCK